MCIRVINMKNYGNIELNQALKFILAGKCEFVLYSTKINDKFEYKLTKKESKNKENEFIYFLNTKVDGEFKYAGVIWFDDKTNEFRFGQGAKGQLEGNHLNIRSLLFVLNKLNLGGEPQHCEVYHVGTCGRCGKKLTTPESILTGLGPECCKKVGVPRVKINRHNEQDK